VIPRRQEAHVRERLADSAVVALLGPRQVGKTTLALAVAGTWPEGSVYLDLERPADLRRLDDADAFLRAQSGLVVLDEVHRVPELFEVLRGVVDERRRQGRRYGQFLLLGSASLDLVRSTSESLAGRVAHVDLAPIDQAEGSAAGVDPDSVWLRGGFPDSLLAVSDESSLTWRVNLIRSYLERDVPMFAPRIPAQTMGRLWTMLAHNSGGQLNSSKFGAGLGVAGTTVSRYVDLLVDLGLVRRLQPWFANTGKRLTRTPKAYVRDTGLLHALLEIPTMHALLGHPVAGPSYETLAIETLVNAAGPRWTPYFYRTADGAEVDLILVRGGTPEVAVEVKRSTAPTTGRGFQIATADLGIERRYIVHPGNQRYARGDGSVVIGLTELADDLSDDAH
jgi:predicted AAA+ superfamily ATPase